MTLGYSYDGLGSVAALTNDVGAVTDTYSYDVFGAVRGSTGSAQNTWRFTGEQNDENSGLYYLRARFYDPVTGRFLSQDPLSGSPSLPATLNGYSYAINNPLILTDPSGRCLGLGDCGPIDDVADCVGSPVECAEGLGEEALDVVGSNVFTAAACGGPFANPGICLVSLLVNPTTRPYALNAIQILDIAPWSVLGPWGMAFGTGLDFAAFLAFQYQIETSDCLSPEQKDYLTGLNVSNLTAGLLGNVPPLAPYTSAYEWGAFTTGTLATTCDVAEAPGGGKE